MDGEAVVDVLRALNQSAVAVYTGKQNEILISILILEYKLQCVQTLHFFSCQWCN